MPNVYENVSLVAVNQTRPPSPPTQKLHKAPEEDIKVRSNNENLIN